MIRGYHQIIIRLSADNNATKILG